jgi:1-acyl-sn-glycerol-3-phosphate acyltransferase
VVVDINKPVSLLRRALEMAWGLVSAVVFALLVFLSVLLALVLPDLAWRRGFAAGCARLFFRVALMPCRVTGLERLPEGNCVVVSNHASYLDGPLLFGVLPPRFSFVIKKEVTKIKFAALLLNRLGHKFVDRFNRHEGAADARRILRAALGGDSVVFFAEGTFHPEPGLHRFHVGAFVTARQAGLKVVPVVIRGTRQAFGGNDRLPRPGRLEVEILEPLPAPDPDDPHSVTHVRDESRRRILERLGEPDLA